MKVKIKKLPSKKHGGTTSMHSGQQTPPTDAMADPRTGKFHGGNTPEIKVNSTLKPTSKENATLEAELGETVITNLQGEGIPEFFKVGGKRHSQGGTPLNLPKHSFIFSRDSKLKVKGADVLEMFGKTGKAAKKAYTPADLSKKYDINVYREILANPFSDKLQRETAEMMIQNYNLKLGALALTQESMKGFDAGIPQVAHAYMEAVGIRPEDLMISEAPGQEQLQQFKGGGAYGGKKKVRIKSLPKAKYGIPKYADGGPTAGQTRGDYVAQQGQFVKLSPEASSQIWSPKHGWISEHDKGATQPETSGRTTKKQNIPKGAVKWDPTKEGYNRDDVQAGDYILQDGRYRKVTGYGRAKYEGDYKNEKLGDFSDDYALMVDKFEGNDGKLKNALYENYLAALDKAKPGKNLSQADIDAAKAMSPDEVWNNFKYKQESNFAVQNQLGDLSDADKKDAWDKNPKLAGEAAQAAGYEPLDKIHVAAFQAAYIGMKDMAASDEYKDDLRDFGLIQTGRGDEQVSGTGEGTISQIDGWDGNTTSGQVMIPRDSQMMTEDVADIDVKDPAVVDTETKRMTDSPAEDPNLFWTEDVNNIAGDFQNLMSVKKHRPWEATAQFNPADPNFVDFRGAANRMSSQTAGIARGASNFSPGAYGAIANNMQGAMAEGITALQAQEQASNVGIDNQFEQMNTQALNQYNQNRATQETRLWDKNTMVNQQFDNAKMALRNNLRNSINNAWTNRGKTQNMNLMAPNFSIDPVTGYRKFTGDNRELEASQQNSTAASDEISRLQHINPDWTATEAMKAYKLNQGMPIDDYPQGVDPRQVGYPGGPPRQ